MKRWKILTKMILNKMTCLRIPGKQEKKVTRTTVRVTVMPIWLQTDSDADKDADADTDKNADIDDDTNRTMIRIQQLQ